MTGHEQTARTRPTQALVLAGHGSQRHPNSSAPLVALADRIRNRRLFDEVRTAFWKEAPTLRDVRHVVEADLGYVVPVLTSEGYFAGRVFPRELGVGDAARPAGGPRLHDAEPLGTHPSMVDVLGDRVDAAIEGDPAEVGVAVVGHGTERYPTSAVATEAHVDSLRERTAYAEVTALFLDEPPYVADVTDHLDAAEIVVVPFFVADGYHTSRDVPDALGHPGIGATATIDGRTVHYDGAVGTEPSLAAVVVKRAVEAGAAITSEPVSAEPAAAGQAFLEWVDAAATGRTFGELSIRGSTEGYRITHRGDAGAPRRLLARVDSPGVLRERVRTDDRGRYRPLAGTRSLPTGWQMTRLDAATTIDAVRAVYPGSIALWHQTQRGDLTPTALEETIDRQTGIYAELADLDRTARSAVIEAVRDTCVRDRRWSADGDADGSPDADGIPCREACSFLLTAVHAFSESDGDAADVADLSITVYRLAEPANEYRDRYADALSTAGEAGSEPVTPAGGSR